MIRRTVQTCVRLSSLSLSTRASAVSNDGSLIICWHPKQNIPYEMTKPLPRNVDAFKATESPLKLQFDRTTRPTIQEVASALCKSPRTIKPKRQERSFSPYHWEDLISRRRL